MVSRLSRGHYLATIAVMAVAGFSAVAVLLHSPKAFAILTSISVNFQETVPGTDTSAHTFTVQPKSGNTNTGGFSGGSASVKGTKSGSNVIYKGTINNVKIIVGGRECTNGGCQYDYQVCDSTSNSCSGTWSGAQAPGRVTFTAAAAAGGAAGGGTGTGTAGAASSGTTCGGGSFDWIICPTDSLFQTLAQKLMEFMQSLLYINTSQSSGIFGNNANGTAYYKAWNTFRILGTALIVIAGLVMVSAQAFGFEFLDAYTIRKVLPRLFVAVIGMSLSWPLLNFVINFFNIVGQDIQQIMYAPFSSLPNHAALSDGIVSWGFLAIIAGLLAAGFGAVLLPVLGAGALALLVAVLVLIVRQIGVTLLVILAPFAIAAYVLPNTKKIWDIWKDNFLGLMFMYPIIMMLIAAGEIFGAVGKSGSFAQQIVGIVAFFVPYFMIPLAFRMATGFISNISGMMNDRSKGAFDRLRAARGNIAKNRAQSLRGYNRFKGGTEKNFRGRMNRALGRIGNVNEAGFNPTRMRSNMQRFERTHHGAEAAEFREKNASFGMYSGNEDFVYADMEAGGNEGKLKKILMNKYGYDENTTKQVMAQIRDARAGTSDETYQRASVMALAASGTGLKERDIIRTNANYDMVDAAGNVVTNKKMAAKDHVQGGAGELNSYINAISGDDRVAAASLAVASRGLAGQARRFDISGNSTGTALGLLEQQYAYEKGERDPEKAQSAYEVTGSTIRGALEGQGGNYVVGARKAAVEAFAPEMTNNLSKKFTSGVGGGVDEIGLSRELAKLAGRYDAMAQVAPENAEVMADKVLGQTMVNANNDPRFHRKEVIKVPGPDGKETTALRDTGVTMTVREMIEMYRDDPDFLNMRKEFGQSGRQGAVQAAQQSAQLQAAGAVQPIPQAGPQQPL